MWFRDLDNFVAFKPSSYFNDKTFVWSDIFYYSEFFEGVDRDGKKCMNFVDYFRSYLCNRGQILATRNFKFQIKNEESIKKES